MSLQNGEIERIANCTPSDTANNLRIVSKRSDIGGIEANRFWVGASGTVIVQTIENDVITLTAVIAGRWHKLPRGAIRIRADSTATGIVIGTTVG